MKFTSKMKVKGRKACDECVNTPNQLGAAFARIAF